MRDDKKKTGSRIRMAVDEPEIKVQEPRPDKKTGGLFGRKKAEEPTTVEQTETVQEAAEKPIEETVPKAQPVKKAKNRITEDLDREEKASKNGMTLSGVLFMILLIMWFVSIFFFMNLNADGFSPAYAISRVQANISNFYKFATGGEIEGMINVRVYMMTIIVMSGMGLAAAGAVYKAIFRNTLASPDVMGVQSGGNLGNILYVLLIAEEGLTGVTGTNSVTDAFSAYAGRNLQCIMIFACCFISVILLSAVATTAGRGKMSSSSLVLTGTIFSAIISTFVNMIQFNIMQSDGDDPRLEVIKDMALGSFDYAQRAEQVVTMAVIIVPSILILLALAGKMNLYSLGEEEALAAGMNVKLYKYITITLATAMVAVIMGYCGHIAFIAFLVPQIARKIGNPDFRFVLINSVAIGGILMLLVYLVAYQLMMTDALNVLTTTIGGIVMIVMLVGKRGERSAVVTQ